MKKYPLLLAITTWALIIAGCGNGDGMGANNIIGADITSSSSVSAKTTQWNSDYDSDYDNDVETIEDLPKCTSRKDGMIYYVEEDDLLVKCDSEKGKWVAAKTRNDAKSSSARKPSSSAASTPSRVSSPYDLPNCNSMLEGISVYVEAAGGYYYCTMGSWSSSYYGGTQSDYPKSSSSNSSSYLWNTSCGDMWCGGTGSEQVNTGLGNDTRTNGYWFEYNDNYAGGQSTIIWPVEKGNEYNSGSFEPIINACYGICGKASLAHRALTYDAFVGIGFNIVGETSASNHNAAVGDASAWGGICIVYSADIELRVEMSLGETIDHELSDGPPAVYLPTGDNIMKNFSWNDFKMPNWAVSSSDYSVSGLEASHMLVALKIIAQGADGEYNFNIMSIGKSGTCTY